MSTKLFEEFEPVSSKAWKQKIQYDLKGADYNETLVWTSLEGIDVKPFYHPDQFDHFKGAPKRSLDEWKICQTIFVADVQKSNTKALDILSRGAESIRFIIPSEDVDIKNLLAHIDLEYTSIFLDCQFLSSNYIRNFSHGFENHVIKASGAKIHVELDIIGHLARSGNWYNNLKADHENFDSIVDLTNSMTVDGSLYQNAGATMVQQLAYSLAHVNEYFNHLEGGLSEDKKKTLEVRFQVAIGSNYFFEIAKLRALRHLYATLAADYGVNTSCLIVAKPSTRNKTIYDYNTNMLRTTTECMSAVLGGADVINNLPYDAIYHKDNEFGERISRNQLLILKEESYFSAVDNPADGTYYIEALTEELATKSLDLFKDIEKNGGFLSQLKSGTIQRKIKESAQKEQDQFDSGELALVGTNKHPNKEDRMADELQLFPFVKKNPVKTLIEPIIEKRLSETLEKIRLRNENQ